MIKIENIQVSGFEAAFRGLRNPMNSWEKSDSHFGISSEPYNDYDYEVTETYIDPNLEEHTLEWEKEFEIYNNLLLDNGVLKRDSETGAIEYAYIGKKDMELACRMIKAGDDEAKFARMIHIQMDITAPRLYWTEYDTYKVSTVANSCSTMHKIQEKEFTIDDFSHEHLDKEELDILNKVIYSLNWNRNKFNETKDKKYWWHMIQLLPQSYNQKRTVDFNYQTARHMYFARQHHKLDEWREFTNKLLKLPYGKELIGVK